MTSRVSSLVYGKIIAIPGSREVSESRHSSALIFGARGIVLKAMGPRVLEDCIRAVHAGRRWLSVDGLDLAERLSRRQEVEAELEVVLTPRELEIARLVHLQLDNEEIAGRLSITVGTVKIHLHHVFDKLQLRGRADLQQLFREKGY
jgi:DNA-binding NarL/FixJ family response regulator